MGTSFGFIRRVLIIGEWFIRKRPTDGLHEGEEGGGQFKRFWVCESDAVVLAVDGFELVQGLLGEVHTS